MTTGWDTALPGVLRLPSGRLVRGRSLRAEVDVAPEFGLQLSGGPPPARLWPTRWVRWHDFGVPADRLDAERALLETYRRCAISRVQIGCAGGVGRAGTALACLAVLDGMAASEAINFVRERYHRWAVETWGQARFVRAFGNALRQAQGAVG